MNKKQTVKIQALDARNRFGELLELSFYQNKRFQIARKNKPMAWLVGENEIASMKSWNAAIDRIIEYDDAMADTLAILTNKELSKDLLGESKEVDLSNYVALENLLD